MSVDMGVVGVMAAYLPVVRVCVLHSLENQLEQFYTFYNNSNCIYELHICAAVG